MDTFNKPEWKPQKHFLGGSWTQRSTYHYNFIYKFKYWQNQTNVTEIKIVAASGNWLVGDIQEPSGLKEMFCILFVVVVSAVCTGENALNYLHTVQIYALLSS